MSDTLISRLLHAKRTHESYSLSIFQVHMCVCPCPYSRPCFWVDVFIERQFNHWNIHANIKTGSFIHFCSSTRNVWLFCHFDICFALRLLLLFFPSSLRLLCVWEYSQLSSSVWINHSGNMYCGLIQEGGVGVGVGAGVGNTDWWVSAINIWWHFSDKRRVLSGWTVFIWKDSTLANTHPYRFMTHWILSASDGIISYSNEAHHILHTDYQRTINKQPEKKTGQKEITHENSVVPL